MAKKSKNEMTITLTDQDGVDHEFMPLQLFRAGQKDYALLQPVKGEKNELTILKFKFDKKGEAEGFETPTEKEFQAAVEFLESAEGECACGCEEGGCCGGEAEEEEAAGCCCCGGEEEPAPAKKSAKAAKNVVKKAAKKAPAKKPAAKKAAAKKPAKKTAKRARA